jgi:molybdenum cofactor cytidylyltransferase
MSGIGLILLAAGSSSRMGCPKQLLKIKQRSLLRIMSEVAAGSCCVPIVVVLGAYAEQMQSELHGLNLHIVINERWAEGMGTSISAGMEALYAYEPNLAAVAIMLVDQPYVSVSHINQLAEIYQTKHHAIIASAYAGTLGVPAVFDQRFFIQLRNMKTTEGARKLIRKYPQQVGQLPFSKGEIDLDTPEQYQTLLSNMSSEAILDNPEIE